MKREKLLETVGQWEIGGAEFAEFIRYYMKCEEYLHQLCANQLCSDKDRKMIGKLELWLEEEGLSCFLNTLGQIPVEMADRVKDFSRLYQFLLENSEKNVEKLIDHMFYIPERFANDFAVTQIEIFGKIEGVADSFAREGIGEYSFSGNLERGSLFFVLLTA